MAEKDPFAEFQGSVVTEDNPFSEFGGSTLRKKPLPKESKSTTTPLEFGSSPFQTSLPSTKTPTILTPKGKAEYQEQVKAFKPQEVAKEGQPKPPKKVDGGVATSFMKGLNDFNESIFKIPRYIYDLAAIPQNLASEMLNTPDLEADYDDVVASSGYTSPLSVLERLGDHFKGESNQYAKRQEKFNRGIVDSFLEGEYSNSGKQVLNNIAESVPSIIGMAVSGGAGNMGKLGYVSKTLINALPFASKKNAELEGDETIPQYVKTINATLNGLSEVVFDQSFGTQAAIQNIVNIATNEGKEQAFKAAKDFTKGFVTNALKKVQPITGVGKGALEEMTTTMSQNIVDKYTTNPDKDLMEGVLDAGVVGGVTTGSVTALGNVALSSSQKKKAGELMKQRDDLVTDLDNPNLPEDIKEDLDDKVTKIDEKLTNLDNEGEERVKQLSDEDKKIVSEKEAKIASIEKTLQDETLSENTKETLANKLLKEQESVDEILGKPIDPNTQVAGMGIEPAVETTIEEIIIPNEQEAETQSEDIRPEPVTGSDTTVTEERTVDNVEKDQKQVLASYHDALKEAGIYESAQRGTANPSVLEKIKEKFKPQFDALQQERETLDPTKKQLTDEEKLEFAKSEINKGAINWDGDRFSPRPDLGMSWADIRKGQKDLEAGKMTVPAKKLIDVIDKARKAGGYKFTQGSGSAFIDMFVPIGEVSATQLTSEELQDITDNEAQLAKEYDEWFDGLTEQEKNEELNFTEDENTNTGRESKEDVSNQESPKTTVESKTESKPTRPLKESTTFAKLASTVPNNNEVKDYISGENIEKYTGKKAENEQGYVVQELRPALEHGVKVIDAAKQEFGEDYVEKVLDHIENSDSDIGSKALLYVSLENDLDNQRLENPDRELDFQKKLDLVRAKSQAYMRANSIEINMGRLRAIAKVGYDLSKVTDGFFSEAQGASKRKISKAIQADSDAINKEAESLENSDLEQAISEGVEKRIGELYEALPTNRRKRADQAIQALERIQKRLRAKTYDATIGVPIAIIDAGITTIKAAIRAGVNIADAIELGINSIKEKYGKEWLKEETFRKDMLEGFKKEGLEIKQGKRVLSETQKRKLYIKRLEKDLSDLDAQIEAKQKKVVSKDDKYKNDEEIKQLRESRDEKKDILNIIDPSYQERVKLKNDLASAQRSLEEYERRIADNDFESSKKPTQSQIDENLQKLRDKRDKVKEEYQTKKTEFEKSQKQEEAVTVVNTPKDRLEQAKERVKARITELQQQITDKKKELKVRNKIEPDAELKSLQEQEKALKAESVKYLTTESIEKINEGKEKAIVTRLEGEIESLDKQIAEGEKAERADKKDPIKSDKINKLKAEKQAKSAILAEIDPDPKEFTKQALIEAGYGREISVTTKEGKVKKEVIDWKKLAGEEGSVTKIQETVEKSLKGKGYSDAQIIRMKDAFVSEYNALRASIIEKSINELNKLNTPAEAPQRRSSAERLAELYNMGLFDKESDTYDYLMNKALGLSDIGQGAFFEAKDLARALSDLYKRPVFGQKNEFFIKGAVREINQKITKLLNVVALNESNGNYKAAKFVAEYMNLAQRAMLTTLKQAIANPLSGITQRIITAIGYSKEGTDTKELKAQRKELSKMIYNDIVENGGIFYGDVTTPFLSKSQVEDWIINQSDSKFYHTAMSWMLGRNFLEGADSMNKSVLTEKYFTHALIKVLTDKSNPNRMTKEEALKFANEQLTGQKFQEALDEANSIIKDTNDKAGKTILKDNKENAHRLAMDIVKASLLEGNKVTKETIEASYNAAYKGAGFDIGHESNNPITDMVNSGSAFVESKTEQAIKNKDWNAAAAYTALGMINRNFLNPFVGGGTNWLVLGLQKAGLDIVSPAFYYLRKGKGLDLSTPEGMKNVESALLKSFQSKNTNIRVVIGALASLLTASLFFGSDADEDYDKWIKKNKWAQKYTEILTPTVIGMILSYRNNQLGQYFDTLFNKADYFDSYKKAKTAVKEFQSKKRGSDAKGRTELGEIAGSKVSAPLVPWRMFRDLENVAVGGLGLKPRKSAFNKEGFWNGFWKAGMADQVLKDNDK